MCFRRRSTFEFEVQLGEKGDSGIEGFHHDPDVVNALKRQAAPLGVLSLRDAHPTSVPADGCAVLRARRVTHAGEWPVRFEPLTHGVPKG